MDGLFALFLSAAVATAVGCQGKSERAVPSPGAGSSHASPPVTAASAPPGAVSSRAVVSVPATSSLAQTVTAAPNSTLPANTGTKPQLEELDEPGPVVITPPIVHAPDTQHAKAFGWAKDSSELGVCAETERTSAFECTFLKPGGKPEQVTDFHREYGVDATDTHAMQARVVARGYGALSADWPYASELTLTWKSACDAEKSSCVLRAGAALKGEAPVYPIFVENKDVDAMHAESISISRNGKWLGVIAHSIGGPGDSHYDVRIMAVPSLVSQVYNDTGYAHHKSGDFVRAAQLFRRALTVNPQNKLAFYNYACALARQPAPGVEAALKTAIEVGGASVKKRALKDPDFASVHQEPWFIALTK